MNVNLNNIDEIGIFHNDDGSYSAELYMSTATGEHAVVKIPRTSLDLVLTNNFKNMSMELKLEGMMGSL